jgi:DNA-binding winged helix-turn-helix (wHTH) protein
MGATTDITFGRFRLDAAGERVWEGSRTLTLRPKAFAILRYLIAHPGELITKQELLEAVWPGTFIADGVLKESIRQLRDALGDDPAAPQYIETAHRRGYRFVGQIASETTLRRRRTDFAPDAAASEVAPSDAPASDPPSTAPRADDLPERSGGAGVLGREVELARLREWLTRALHGERQIAFVTGEPGIGKTTIVNELLEQASRVDGIWIARGQCLEHYGADEYGMEMWGAFGNILRGWAVATHGGIDEGLAELRRGLSAFESLASRSGGRSSWGSLPTRWPVRGAPTKARRPPHPRDRDARPASAHSGAGAARPLIRGAG